MRRRDFIKGFVGSTARPLAARAQQTGKLPTIGILGPGSSVWGPSTAAFIGRLRELNWVEGRTIGFEYRWDVGHPERVKANAAELTNLTLKPGLLLAAINACHTFVTIAGVRYLSDGAPTCCIATFSSVRRSSSTRSTPA